MAVVCDPFCRSEVVTVTRLVRCNFNYDGSAVNEMSFGIGDVMHITESAPAHFKESWMARRLGVDGTQAAFGAVPNEIR